MSRFFADVLSSEEYQGLFKMIRFAVLDDCNTEDSNYLSFKETFGWTLNLTQHLPNKTNLDYIYYKNNELINIYDMNKKLVRLNELDLHRIVKESVKDILKENNESNIVDEIWRAVSSADNNPTGITVRMLDLFDILLFKSVDLYREIGDNEKIKILKKLSEEIGYAMKTL